LKVTQTWGSENKERFLKIAGINVKMIFKKFYVKWYIKILHFGIYDTYFQLVVEALFFSPGEFIIILTIFKLSKKTLTY
jgi:hypothetical protein